MESIQTILKENKKVQIFIENWQKNNPYKKENKDTFNQKFKNDFNNFLKNSKFSQKTIDLFAC